FLLPLSRASRRRACSGSGAQTLRPGQGPSARTCQSRLGSQPGWRIVGDRAVVPNLAPECAATTAYVPVAAAGMDYLAMTGRSAEHIDFVRSYYKEADLWFDPQANPTFNQTLELDLATVFPSAAGPRRPQDLHGINTLAEVMAETEP